MPSRLRQRPSGKSLRGLVEGVGAEIVEILADLSSDVVQDHSRRDSDRVGYTFRAGAAVTFDDQAVEAEEDSAVMVVGVEVDLQQIERRTRQSEAGLGAKRALEGAAQEIGDEAGRA